MTDCFWCGSELFRASDLVVCPYDGTAFRATTYLQMYEPLAPATRVPPSV